VPELSALGHPRLHLSRTSSTNDRARELALGGAPHGTLVTASEQTAGRGRQGRRWSAPAGSALLMSLVVRSPPPLLPLIAAVAVCDVAGEDAAIKWPNDIVVSAPASSPVASREGGAPGQGTPGATRALAKLAGILVEGRPQQGWAVLGIGLNVAVELDQLPENLRLTGASARDGASPLPAATLGRPRTAIEPTLSSLLASIEQRLGEPAEATLHAWRARDALRGREVAWSGGEGRAEGIDGAGRLVVALADGGQTTLSAGEVHLQSVRGAA
jgi:BirA family transcriptional regulator, biotin operon repressor / biotin---[acetyl-CoA-carboxylase] ligase